ncbi:MAG: hypothetical protein JWR50_2613 [Mucilaginibacter sp.]|nr:hypothetical protein [Mucilaginibacter sp.]
MKKSIRRTKSSIAIIFIFLLSIACTKQKRDFFNGMSDRFDDVKVNSRFYFIKSFGLVAKPTRINGENYWELKNDQESYFSLSGYIRRLNDSIMLVPVIHNGEEHEQKLFDFRESKGNAWKTTLKFTEFYNRGDSIKLSNVKIAERDTIYLFKLKPFMLYKKNQKEEYYGHIFELEVSRRNGIISITKLKAGRPGFDYKATLYPKQSFIKDKNIPMDL